MDDRQIISWLHRRAGFGLTPAELDRAAAAGIGATVDRLVRPGSAGIAPAPDPWTGLDLTAAAHRPVAAAAAGRWVHQMASSPRPFEEWMVWFWHDHFATSVQKVRSVAYLADQLRLLRRSGLGSFPELLRAVSIDPAMLVWLDGRESTGREPNENYGREVLELFSLGIGAYEEADVQAGAKALTGWTVARPRVGQPVPAGEGARFVARRHDDAPQRYLGRDGVHDLDTVVAAIATHRACAPFLAGKLAGAVIGDVTDAEVADLAGGFSEGGLDLAELAGRVLDLAVRRARDDDVEPLVLAPVPWLASILHQTGAAVPEARIAALLAAAGQVPLDPPSVGGWPTGTAWFGTATVAARFDLASLVAEATAADHPARAAAAAGDHRALATALNRPEGFSATTAAALDQARSLQGRRGAAPLALALVSPELVLA